jgi:hypothetical protein
LNKKLLESHDREEILGALSGLYALIQGLDRYSYGEYLIFSVCETNSQAHIKDIRLRVLWEKTTSILRLNLDDSKEEIQLFRIPCGLC